jgi:hypothetical protein
MIMKKLLITGALALLLAGTASARTFTSTDGSKTFEGELRTFNKEAREVTVMMRNGKVFTFTLDKLSEADQKWLAEQAEKPSAPVGGSDVKAQLEAQKIGKNLLRGLRKLKGRSMHRYEMTKVPEYYILYFSASW